MWSLLLLTGGLLGPAPAPSGRAQQDDPVLYAIEGGLAWLIRHEDGFKAGVATEDEVLPDACLCLVGEMNQGQGGYEVGLTGLTLLALARSEDPERFKESMRNMARSLLDAQWGDDPQNGGRFEGLFGRMEGHEFMYGHLIATLALARAVKLVPSAFEDLPIKEALEPAAQFILKSRNPRAGWRYDSPPIGDSDASVTTWAILALDAVAELGDLLVPEEVSRETYDYLHSLTDPVNGRMGYSTRGSPSSRVPSSNPRYPGNDQFPYDLYETVTACGLRAVATLERLDDPMWAKSLDLLVSKHPVSGKGPEETPDIYGLHQGAWVLARTTGGEADAHLDAVAEIGTSRQDMELCGVGSWDPDSPWAFKGGRVYTTAMWVLTLQEVRSAQKGRAPVLFDRAALEKSVLVREALRRAPMAPPATRPGFPKLKARSSSASKAAASWIVRHQSPDGEWSDQAFPRRCTPPKGKTVCAGNGTGSPLQATTCCVLALLGAGANPTGDSELDAAAAAGLRYLAEELTGDGAAPPTRYGGRDWVRDRGLPAVALVEGYLASGAPELATSASWALHAILLDRVGEGWNWRTEESARAAVLPGFSVGQEAMEPNIVCTAIAARALGLGAALGLVEFDEVQLAELASWAEQLIDTDGVQVAFSFSTPALSGTEQHIADARAGALGWLAVMTDAIPRKRLEPVLEPALELDLEAASWQLDLDALGLLAGAGPVVKSSGKPLKALNKWIEAGQAADRKECSEGSWDLESRNSQGRGGRCYETARCLLVLQAADRLKTYKKVLGH